MHPSHSYCPRPWFKLMWPIEIYNSSSYHQFPIVVTFSVVVCLRSLYHHMLSVSNVYPGAAGFCFVLVSSLMMCGNNRIHYGMVVVFDCLHITLPSLCRRIWTYWNSKCFSDIFCRVSLRLSQFSQISCNIWVCMYSADTCILWWLWEYR